MEAIIQDLTSIFIILALGYLAGKKNGFTQDQAQGFNHLVLNYCLPAVLFVSITSFSREQLFADSTMLLVSIGVLLFWYIIAFLAAMKVFHHDRRESGIAGLSAGAPTVGFLGIAVLSPLFGTSSAMSVAIVALVVNFLLVPLSVFFVAPKGTKPAAALISAIKEPVVITPLIAVILVLIGIRIPDLISAPLNLIGHANSGIAVFASGLVLSAHKFEINIEVIWNTIVKLILLPASMLIIALWFGISGVKLEELILLSALPPVFTGMVLAGRYQIYVSMASSTLIVSVILFAVAAPVWIVIARHFAG